MFLNGKIEEYRIGELKFYESHINGPLIVEKEEEPIIPASDNLYFNTLSEPIYIDKKRETNHFFIVGAPGSGKTQFIFPFLEQVRKRKDKVFLYDIKGDFTQSISSIPGTEMILLAPWDKRGSAWLIGEDIFNPQLAREFASRMIPEGEEPLYSNSARLILAGVIYYLQKTKGTDWGISDLVNNITKPREKLYLLLKDFAPESAEMIREPTKLTQNILTNLLSSISKLIDLAEAWQGVEKTFSISKLIHRKEPFTFIMQGSGIYKDLANSLITSILISASAEIETLNDDFNRRIWFFLDEFPQLGELEGFTPLLEIGRSKGVCVVLAIQNINQLKAIYGEQVANSIQSMCNTHIYGRVSIGESANNISSALGTKEVFRNLPIMNQAKIVQGYSSSKDIVPAVSEFYLSKELGPFEYGIKMLISGIGQNYIEVNIPYTKIEKKRERNVYHKWAKRN